MSVPRGALKHLTREVLIEIFVDCSDEDCHANSGCASEGNTERQVAEQAIAEGWVYRSGKWICECCKHLPEYADEG
ncbi:MAG: hypothetical protein HRU00_17305 [Myxococcales bacterium]|nr:hypothetical protein [Myxococcales bacterium]